MRGCITGPELLNQSWQMDSRPWLLDLTVLFKGHPTKVMQVSVPNGTGSVMALPDNEPLSTFHSNSKWRLID